MLDQEIHITSRYNNLGQVGQVRTCIDRFVQDRVGYAKISQVR